VAQPVRTAAVPRAQVPKERAPFPLALPRWERRRWVRLSARGAVGVLGALALVLILRALGVRVIVGPERGAMPAPAMELRGPSLPTPGAGEPAPEPMTSATAAIEAPTATAAPAAASAPIRSRVPGKSRNAKKAQPELIE
jgi:hypothetical protein